MLRFTMLRLIVVGVIIAGLFAEASDAQDTRARLISAPQFVLSEEAVAAGIDGTMKVARSVNKDGTVKDVDLLGGLVWPCSASPDAQLDAVRQAIRKSVMAAKFSPAEKNGKPVEMDLVADFPIGEAFQRALSEAAAREAAESGNTPRAVKTGIINGRALSLPKPIYPTKASAVVHVQILIDEQGQVAAAGPLDGHPAFRGVSRSAACRARFSPTVLAGKPVKVFGVITYAFDASDPRNPPLRRP